MLRIQRNRKELITSAFFYFLELISGLEHSGDSPFEIFELSVPVGTSGIVAFIFCNAMENEFIPVPGEVPDVSE